MAEPDGVADKVGAVQVRETVALVGIHPPDYPEIVEGFPAIKKAESNVPVFRLAWDGLDQDVVTVNKYWRADANNQS